MNQSKLLRRVAALLMLATACGSKLVVDDQGQQVSTNPDGEATGGSATSASVNVDVSGCPEAPPATNDPCTVREGDICTFRAPDADTSGYQDYEACGCWVASGGAMLWYCYDEEVGPACPEIQPIQGSGCFGMLGQTCDYAPYTQCICPGDSANQAAWNCGSLTDLKTGTPNDIDPSTPVASLSDAERNAWCNWYLTAAQGPGFPQPATSGVENGYVKPTVCEIGHEFPCEGSLPVLPVADCVANLALSSCGAPVAELSDCALTILNECWPSPHGCAAYLDWPGCDGTMIVGGPFMRPPANGSSTPGAAPTCGVRVE
jgi:hypothetical protein